MLPIDARGLDQACARLYSRTARVIGWGTGSVFDYFHGLYPIRLDYLVDNDRTRWGQRRRGIEIVSPERLLSEVPGETVIVIYSSSWTEIRDQIARIGDFLAIPASAAFARRLRARKAFVGRDNRRAAGKPIALRHEHDRRPGAGDERCHRACAADPHRAQSGQPRPALDLERHRPGTPGRSVSRCRRGCDERQAASRRRSESKPADRLDARRRRIARSTLGARTILKTRTDLAILGESVFEQAERWLQNFDAARAREPRPSQPADRSVELHAQVPAVSPVRSRDARRRRRHGAATGPRHSIRDRESCSPSRHPIAALAAVNLAGHPAESYLGLQFCRTLGRPVAGTLVDSWAFYRDLFAVVDNEWFDLLWFKNLSIPDAACRSGVRQMVTGAFWQRLFACDPLIERDLLEINPSQIALGALAGAA